MLFLRKKTFVDGINNSMLAGIFHFRNIFDCKIVISHDHYLLFPVPFSYMLVKHAVLRFSFKIHLVVVVLYKHSFALQLYSLVQKLLFSDKELDLL